MKSGLLCLFCIGALVSCAPTPKNETKNNQYVIDTTELENKLENLKFGNFLDVEVLGSNRYMTRFIDDDRMRMTITGFAFAKYVEDAVNENPNFVTIAYVYNFKDQKLLDPIVIALEKLNLSNHVKFFPAYDVESGTKSRVFSVRLDGTNEYYLRTDLEEPLPSKLTGLELESFLVNFHNDNSNTRVFLHVQNPDDKEYMLYFENIVNKPSLKAMDPIILTLF